VKALLASSVPYAKLDLHTPRVLAELKLRWRKLVPQHCPHSAYKLPLLFQLLRWRHSFSTDIYCRGSQQTTWRSPTRTRFLLKAACSVARSVSLKDPWQYFDTREVLPTRPAHTWRGLRVGLMPLQCSGGMPEETRLPRVGQPSVSLGVLQRPWAVDSPACRHQVLILLPNRCCCGT